MWFYAFEQQTLIRRLSRGAPKANHFVVFDACRDELNIAGSSTKSLGATKGFSRLADTSGLLIAYSTAPGQTASDVGDKGGPYARALARELVRPGVEIVNMFRNVQIAVKREINQHPWLSFPSMPEIYLAGRPIETAKPKALREEVHSSAPAKRTAREAMRVRAMIDWQILKNTKSVAVLEAFAMAYKETVFARLANARIRELKRQSAALPRDPSGERAVVAVAGLSRAIQERLTELGCYTKAIDGIWGAASSEAVVRFNHTARKNLTATEPTGSALQVLKDWDGSDCRPEGGASGKPRIRRRGLCVNGNIDHCRVACRKGVAEACRRLKTIPASLRYAGGICETGNLDVCRRECRRGDPAACKRLRR